MGLYDYTVYSVLERNAVIYANRTALVLDDERITYKRLLEEVDKVAKGLLEAGVEKGDRVAVLAYNSLEYVLLYGACAKLGAILLLINWRLNPEEVAYVFSDGSPKMVFVGKEFMELAKGAMFGVKEL